MTKIKEALKRLKEWLADLSIAPPAPVPVPVNSGRNRRQIKR